MSDVSVSNVVGRYLDCLATSAWQDLATCLAPDVERLGPYRDAVRGRDAYTEFLRTTIESLSGYELHVVRALAAGASVVVELHETVDDGDGRLRTDEAVVFDVDDELITRVAVYLQTSQRV
jgi:limonene-1,2-epoxide hydrolase